MDWKKEAKNMLKAEIKRKGYSYEEIALKLAELGIEKSTTNINSTINKGSFSAVFLLQIAKAIGLETLDLGI